MAVHYRFGSSTDMEVLKINGQHISVANLKKSIMQQKGIGKKGGVDLKIRNDETKEVYKDENTLIAVYSTVNVVRVPVTEQKKRSRYRTDAPSNKCKDKAPQTKYIDLTSADISEEEKIRAMMIQSTQDYDPSSYMKIRGSNQTGLVPPHYRCYKCQQRGSHWIKDCPYDLDGKRIKRSSGIPRSFMVPVEGPSVTGAMMTPDGTYAVFAPAHHLAVSLNTTARPQMSPPSAPDSPMSASETLKNEAEQRMSNVPMPYSSGHEYSYSVISDSRRNFQGSMRVKGQRNHRWDKQSSRLHQPLRSRYDPYRRRDLVIL